MTRHRLALAAAVGIVAAVSLIPLPPVARSDHGEKVAQATPAPVGKPEAIEAEVPAPAPAPEAAGEDLVKPPRVVLESYVAPQYPEAARKNGIEGKVVLDVTVGEDGTVGKITVTEGVPEWPSLEESAQEAVRQWKFEPATEGGEPVEMSVAIPVMFGLDASKQTAEADTAPELVNESVIKPEYPEDARKDGVSGKVLLDVVIKKDGSPGKISVKQGIPGYPSFGEKAVEAVSQWKFKPATKDGEPIEMITAIPLMFRLDDAAKPVSDPGSE